jgi:hypothetical protein
LDDQEKKYPITCNFSQQLFNFFQKKGISCKQTSDKNADLIWHHVLSIGYSFSYYTENADGLRQDWPRIPLPNNKEALIRSAELGRRVAELLNPLEPVAGVTSGDIRPELREMGVITRVDGKPLRLDEGDLLVTAGWGYCGGSGITMPGKGRINDRPYHAGERSTLAAGAEKLGLSFEEVERRLGPSTMDVFLNETVYWKNVPANVWGYYIGGYQVIKKWLSYREESQLGRPLTLEEAREVRAMIRRIAVILLLGPSLDANYQDIKESTYSWPGNH